ncbi:hypothetical protein U1701_17395 [Sphingomonas sp. PB2P19]|uniref:hypothetical protein n=1 Tax=Sphingomonas rhamnosi TaxID=3096156 RepID=UPI002FC70B6C
MIVVASHAADTARIGEQSRILEALDLAWRALAAEFGRTAGLVRQAHMASEPASDMLVTLVELDDRLSALEDSAVVTLRYFNDLVERIQDA